MSVAVVVGAGRAAESITKLLLGCGSKVALVGSKPSTQANLIAALKEEAEEDLPFMFVDDLKHQEDQVRHRLSCLTFHKDMGSIIDDAKIVFDAEEGKHDDVVYAARAIFPRTPVASLSSSSSIALKDNLHLGLRLYEPVQITKIAQAASNGCDHPVKAPSLRQCDCGDQKASVMLPENGQTSNHADSS